MPEDRFLELRFELLGGFRVTLGTRIIDHAAWRRRKVRSLIKLLALAPRHRLHRDQVIEHLWPELEPPAATNNLHQTLHIARLVLAAVPPDTQERSPLLLQNNMVELAPTRPLWVDVRAFEQGAREVLQSRNVQDYEALLQLYKGDLLPEDIVEDWAIARREELRNLHLKLLTALAELHEDRGDIVAAIDVFERVVGIDPVEEDAHASLMRLYASAGQRNRSLRQYRILRQTLRDDLDLEPDASVQLLHRSIQTGDFRGRAVAGRPTNGTGHRRSGNVPLQLSSFVGRAKEVPEVRRLLSLSRMVTLTGLGGAGKTRLALEVGRQLEAEYPDGVWMVDLARLVDPVLIPRSVASTLGLREETRSIQRSDTVAETRTNIEEPAELVPEPRWAEQAVVAMITTHLRSRRALIILDNCEHMVQACADLSHTLLTDIPGLTLLATSRQSLGVAGEIAWRIPPLPLPSPTSSLEDAAVSEAVCLFAERARLILPEFRLDARNIESVVDVCRKLEGVPLAIELAAARVGVLSPRDLAARLEDGFRLLVGSDRAAPARHRTLRAAVQWSYDLLSISQRRLFARLAVFAGGCTLDAAEAVAGSSTRTGTAAGECVCDPVADTDAWAVTDVLSALSELVDQSLVTTEAVSDGTFRYRLPASLRELGLEQLAEAGELAQTRQRHLGYFLDLAEQSEREIRGPHQSQWAVRLELELDNLRTALDWSITEHQTVLALRISSALWPFCEMRGYVKEGQQWLNRALSLANRCDGESVEQARAKALNASGNFARVRGDLRQSALLHEASLAIRRTLGDARGIATSLHNLGYAARSLGDYQLARTYLTESLALFQSLAATGNAGLSLLELAQVEEVDGDTERAQACYEESLVLFREAGHAQGIATVLNRLGVRARTRHELLTARTLHEQSLALHRERGDARGIGITLSHLARVSQVEGHLQQTASLAAESLRSLRTLGVTDETAGALGLMAEVACSREQYVAAAQVLGAVTRLHEVNDSWRPFERAMFEQTEATVRAAVGEDAFGASHALGQLMTLDQAVEAALHSAEEP